MIYAAKTDTYYGTFDNLKKWLCNSGDTGELKFHRNFIDTLFRGTPELSSTIDVNIIAKDEYKASLFLNIEKKVLGWKKPADRTRETVYPDKLCIPFASYHDFIVTLRNRYFHYTSSRSDNIALDDIYDPELIFSLVNKQSLFYIAILFTAIIKHQYK